MPGLRRGPDRRRNDAKVSFPLRMADGGTIRKDRRAGADRRKNAFISRQYLCKRIPYESVERVLRNCDINILSPGEVLLEPGQDNHYLYLLKDGRLQVRLESADSDLGFPIEPGECVGEMSIIDGKPVSAFVVAEQPSEVVAIPNNVFWQDLAPVPGVARNLMQLLAERMRKRIDVTVRALEQQLRLEHLERELDVAKDIQASMLPRQVPLFPDHPRADVYAVMKPAREVGGDFFDAFPLDENRICIAVGDVSGKGVPAALFMVRTLTELRTVLHRGDSLARAIARLNVSLCQNNDRCMFVSLFVGILDTSNGCLRYANCGHNPPLVGSGDAGYEFLDLADGIIAGVEEHAVYAEQELTLAPGARLVLYTDGVTEAQRKDKQFFTEKRLQSLLSDMEPQDAFGTVQNVQRAVEAFTGDAPQFDDITLLVLRYAAD